MVELNGKIFRQLLEKVPEDTTEDSFKEIVPYLRNKVCFPILNRQPLIPNQVDYSRFTLDDLYDLLDTAQEHCLLRSRLQGMNGHLCRQAASQSLRQAFC